jgi:hypothetical protein
LTAVNYFETKIYNPPPVPDQRPQVEPDPAPVLSLLPQSPDESAQRIAVPRAKKALVPRGRKGKK